MPKTCNKDFYLGLAPMHGVTDFPTRLWFSLVSGCKSMTTPFLRVTETYPHKIPLEWAPDVFDHEVKEVLGFKTMLQMMASNPKRFSETFFQLQDFIDEVELNCGCPSPKVVSHAAGSSLLKETRVFSDFIHSISRDIGPDRFCVKIRTGYDNEDLFFDLIDSIKDLNLKKLTIHGRTKSQKYTGLSRMDLIHEASERVPFPVIASGDVIDLESFEKALKIMPKIKGLLIGRGALKNPFVFQEIQSSEFTSPQSFRFLWYALYSYALLVELYKTHYDKLRTLILNGLFQEVYLDDEDQWRQLFELLYETLFEEPYNSSLSHNVSTVTLGRVKLLWSNFLQGSLNFVDGRNLLRSKNSSSFFQQMNQLSLEAFPLF